jgi:FkbM family methyltransferase
VIGKGRHRLDAVRLRHGLAPTGSVPVVRLGSAYGGWAIPEGLIRADSVVYSAGVGEDVTFDLALIARTGCEVWAFDPTPRSIEFAGAVGESRFHFLPIGLWSEDVVRQFFPPKNPEHVSHSTVRLDSEGLGFEAECRRVGTIMRDLGHRHVDLLKLDVEGAEFEVLGSLGEPLPTCICVEIHLVRPLASIVDFIHELDYEVVAVDGWNVTLLRRVH